MLQQLAALFATPYLERGAFERPAQPDPEEVLRASLIRMPGP